MSATSRRTRRQATTVPTDRSALDNATLLPACGKHSLTPVLYFDAIDISSVPHHTREVNPQAAEATPGGFTLADAGRAFGPR